MITNYFNNNKPDKNIIFIVEDNEIYAKSLQMLIIKRFPNIKEIKIFRIGELCLTEMHRNPNIVIIDFFLNAKYKKAQNGLEIIKLIKAQRPLTNIIILSAQIGFNIALEAKRQYDCLFVQKDHKAFNKIELFIKDVMKSKNPFLNTQWY